MSNPPQKPKKNPSLPTIENARRWVMQWAARRDLTEHEFRERLTLRGVMDPDIDVVLAEARSYGWLNEDRIAERAWEVGAKKKGWGDARVEHALGQRGVEGAERPDEVVEEESRAMQLAAAKKWSDPARMARALGARGFSEDTIRAVLDEFFPDWENPHD